MTGIQKLEEAEWLLGFDFDGTLADITKGHSVSSSFFSTLASLQEAAPTSWGICTGRSLEFLVEGMKKAKFAYFPDFVVTQERDIHYRITDELKTSYRPDSNRNNLAQEALQALFKENNNVLGKIQEFVKTETKAQWINIPGDPAGIIATSEREVDKIVEVYNTYANKTAKLEYQRSTIYLRFSHKDYCKGSAIQYLQTQFSILHSNTLVMGDNYNDLTMLNSDIAKYYGAPANAVPLLRNTLNNNGGFISSAKYTEGVIEALENLLKIKTT